MSTPEQQKVTGNLRVTEIIEALRHATETGGALREALRRAAEANAEQREALRQAAEIDAAQREALRQATEIDPAQWEALRRATEMDGAQRESVRRATDVASVQADLLAQYHQASDPVDAYKISKKIKELADVNATIFVRGRLDGGLSNAITTALSPLLSIEADLASTWHKIPYGGLTEDYTEFTVGPRREPLQYLRKFIGLLASERANEVRRELLNALQQSQLSESGHSRYGPLAIQVIHIRFQFTEPLNEDRLRHRLEMASNVITDRIPEDAEGTAPEQVLRWDERTGSWR